MSFSLEKYGIRGPVVHRNLTAALLYEQALRHERGSAISSVGALTVRSAEKTGRSPKDKRVVRLPNTEKHVWWGSVNMEFSEESFKMNRQLAVDYLNSLDRVHVFDGFAGWDPQYRIKVRIICSRAYHALFMQNMLIRPSAEELESFGEPDYVVINAGCFPANCCVPQVTTSTSVALHLERQEFVILGTQYAGEMKKGIFTIMNYIMPKRGVLSMHCSANEGSGGDVSIFFGLSGTGKTTLSADTRRRLIGDDEHCWSDRGVFNIEGGCYAKCIGLSAESDPQIYGAIKFGSILENVVFDEESRSVDYNDTSITQNTRCSYPIEYIPNAKIPCVGGHPRNVVLLTCDAFGVLPPVSKLSPAHTMYHFISGYTAKVAGTEVGIEEPEATFSACFGAAFLVWHPSKYAEMLAERIRKHGSQAWLINTGWSGGAYGTGSRIKLSYTRAIIDAIHDGSLAEAPVEADRVFGFDVPTKCAGVPAEILVPRNTWADKDAYDRTAKKLADLFKTNFEKFSDGASTEIRAAGPK